MLASRNLLAITTLQYLPFIFQQPMWLTLQQKLSKIFDSAVPECHFKIGQVVTVEDIDYPLIVTEVLNSLRKSDPLVSCKWFDRSTRQTRTKLIHQSKLKPFDWSIRTL